VKLTEQIGLSEQQQCRCGQRNRSSYSETSPGDPDDVNEQRTATDADPEGQAGDRRQSSEWSVLLFGIHDAAAASLVADLTRVNLVIASHIAILFCQWCAVGRFKPW